MTQASTQASVYHRSTFLVSQMDCPSEENLMRMALQGLQGVNSLEFDPDKRRPQVVHTGSSKAVLERLAPLNLGTLADCNRCVSEPPRPSRYHQGENAERDHVAKKGRCNAHSFRAGHSTEN